MSPRCKGELLLTAYASGLTEEQVAGAIGELVTLVSADTRRLVRDVGSILAGRRHIEQANGLVMAARRCGAQEAFELLRATSQHHQVKVHDLAVGRVAERFAGHRTQAIGAGPGDRRRVRAKVPPIAVSSRKIKQSSVFEVLRREARRRTCFSHRHAQPNQSAHPI